MERDDKTTGDMGHRVKVNRRDNVRLSHHRDQETGVYIGRRMRRWPLLSLAV